MIERRKHRRIVTLKNFGRFMLVALLALAAMNVVSEHRAPREHEYGRPVQQQPVVSTPAPEVIHEAPAPVTAPALAETPPPPPPSNPATQSPSNSISITGDESGITIATPKHKLRGGFFRQ
jgi:hypothetical protein